MLSSRTFQLMTLDDSSCLMTIFDIDDLFFKEFVNHDVIFHEKIHFALGEVNSFHQQSLQQIA